MRTFIFEKESLNLLLTVPVGTDIKHLSSSVIVVTASNLVEARNHARCVMEKFLLDKKTLAFLARTTDANLVINKTRVVVVEATSIEEAKAKAKKPLAK